VNSETALVIAGQKSALTSHMPAASAASLLAPSRKFSLRIPTVKPLIGIFRITHGRGRHPRIAELLLLDGNTALANVDLDASGLLPLLLELIAQDHGGDGERADDEVENIACHRPFLLCP
jgi:hypothetical protein